MGTPRGFPDWRSLTDHGLDRVYGQGTGVRSDPSPTCLGKVRILEHRFQEGLGSGRYGLFLGTPNDPQFTFRLSWRLFTFGVYLGQVSFCAGDNCVVSIKASCPSVAWVGGDPF